jgi:hypothetical protein
LAGIGGRWPYSGPTLLVAGLSPGQGFTVAVSHCPARGFFAVQRADRESVQPATQVELAAIDVHLLRERVAGVT